MNGNRSMDLDETDAHFVDVIHTGAGILGQWGPNGHADFYVNGGSSQPGCATSSILRELIRSCGEKEHGGDLSKNSVRRNALVRSHKGDTVLHRVDYDKKGILGGAVRKSVFLPDRMVQSEERRSHPDGRGRPSYVSALYIPHVLVLAGYFIIKLERKPHFFINKI